MGRKKGNLEYLLSFLLFLLEIKEMGLGPSDAAQKEPKMGFDPADWQQTPFYSYTNNADPQYSSSFVVLAHKHTQGLEAEKYEIFFNSQSEYFSYLNLFYERKKLAHLVNTLHIEQSAKKGMCSTFLSATVYIERIPIRLFELIDMPLAEGLYMLEAALEGYQKMFEKTGYFQVSSDMIGVDRQGRVKVWINRNLAKNFPDFNKIDHNQGEPDFVFRLIGIVTEAIDYAGHSPTFLDFIADKKKVLTFQTAKSLLKLYLQNFQIPRLKLMKSILVVYRNQAPDHSHANNLNRNFFRKNTEQVKRPDTIKRNDSAVTTKRRQNSREVSPKGDQFVQPISRNQSNMNGEKSQEKNTIHFSFIKNEPKMLDLDDYLHLQNHQTFPELPPHLKGGCVTPNAASSHINPAISFYYKNPNGGLYSPQNMAKAPKPVSNLFSKENRKGPDWMRRQLRRSVPNNGGLGRKMEYYNSNGDIYEIDPDIATDLQRFSS